MRAKRLLPIFTCFMAFSFVVGCGPNRQGNGTPGGGQATENPSQDKSIQAESPAQEESAGQTESASVSESSFTDGPISLDNAVVPDVSDWVYKDMGDTIDLYAYKGSDTVIRVPSELDGKPVNIAKAIRLEEGTHVRGVVWDEGFKDPLSIESRIDGLMEHVEAIRIPSTMTEKTDSFTGSYNTPFLSLPGLKTIEVAEENPNYYVENGVLYHAAHITTDPEDTCLVLYPALKEDETFTQPDNTYVLGNAFRNTQYLKRVENFDGASDSFGNSSVEEVVCAKNKWYFQDRQFNGEHIRKITLSEVEMSIGASAFQYLPALEEIALPGENSKQVTDNGVLYWRDAEDGKLSMTFYPSARPGEEYHVLKGTKEVSGKAFDSPAFLKRLVIEDPETDTFEVPDTIEVVK